MEFHIPANGKRGHSSIDSSDFSDAPEPKLSLVDILLARGSLTPSFLAVLILLPRDNSLVFFNKTVLGIPDTKISCILISADFSDLVCSLPIILRRDHCR